MRLTKFDREAFVRAVIQDVPQIDYVAQAQKLLTDAAVASMPPKVRPLLYRLASLLGDINAIAKGRIIQRLVRKQVIKTIFRGIR